MTDEEYQRLKEAEKEHLRAKKKLQATLKTLRRNQRVRDALHRIARSAQGALDRASDLIDKLAAETAHDEARFEIVMGDDGATPDAPDTEVEAFEQERRAARARQLIQQMKQAGHVSSAGAKSTRSSHEDETPASSDASASGATSSDKDLSTPSTDDELPEKTIGRMR